MRPTSLPLNGHPPNSMATPSVMMNQGLHTRQTIDRLQCIQKHLQNPELFIRTAQELLEWCCDVRAFHRQFHECIMSCLKVINDVAGRPGYDLGLCHKLLTLCHNNRNMFNSNATAMLDSWLQNVRSLMMKRKIESLKQNRLSPQAIPLPTPRNNNSRVRCTHPHTGQRRHDPSAWNQRNPHSPHSNQQPSLSVITTARVWEVSSSQTPHIPTYSQSSSHPYVHQNMEHPSTHLKAGEGSNMQYNFNNNYVYKQAQADTPVCPPGHRGIPTRMAPQHHHINSDQPHHPPPAAAAAAAAAVATATATATATLIKEQQEKNQMNSYGQVNGGAMSQNVGGPHDPQSMRPHHSHFPPEGEGHLAHPHMSDRGRSQVDSPYARASSVPTSFPSSSMTSPRSLTHNGPSMYNDTCNGPHRSTQSYSHFNGNTNMGQHFRGSPEVYNQPGPSRPISAGPPTLQRYNPSLPNRGPSPNHPILASQQHQVFHNNLRSCSPAYCQRAPVATHFTNDPRFPNSMPPIPGNPTPPLTPGSSHCVPPYPKTAPLGLHDGKPSHSVASAEPIFPPYVTNEGPTPLTDVDDLRLTFPINDGVILGPFRLEHNLSLSSHAFHLRPSVYDTLSERPDLELQFKCFHHDDVMKHTNWPASVQVSINGTPTTIPRGSNRTTHKPLYLKRFCPPGRNSIDINVSQCCCSHFFILQLVHRPSIRSVLRGLMDRRILPEAHCRNRIKSYFNNGNVSANNEMVPYGTSNDATEPQGHSAKVTLQCPITYRRIQIPARGQSCKHIQCFDLESYLQLNSENATWKCPICQKPALLEILEVDEFIQSILKSVQGQDCHLVAISATCAWKILSSGIPFNNPASKQGQKRRFSNGMMAQQSYNNFKVKQEPIASSGGFVIKPDKPLLSALQIKREPNLKTRQDCNGPPSKRLKSVPSPGTALSHVPVPNPVITGGYSKMRSGSNPGYPHLYDQQRLGWNAYPSRSHPGGSALHGTSGVLMAAEISSDVAANDMVPIEKRLNPAALPGPTCISEMSRDPSSSRKPVSEESLTISHESSNAPGLPNSSTVLTPQSVGSNNNNCSTSPSQSNASYNVSTSSSNPPQCSSSNGPGESGMNPKTPVVSLPNSNGGNLNDDTGLLDSFFGENSIPPSTDNYPEQENNNLNKELEEIIRNDEALSNLMDVNNPASSSSTTFEEELLSLFD